MFSCKLWKITISSLFPSGNNVRNVFWAYNFDEAKARAAAKRWIKNENNGESVDTIVSVDLIK
jgi:hypothetical protein